MIRIGFGKVKNGSQSSLQQEDQDGALSGGYGHCCSITLSDVPYYSKCLGMDFRWPNQFSTLSMEFVLQV